MSTPGSIMTVDGPLAADALGITLPNEHLLVDGWGHRSPNYRNSLLMELARFKAAGGSTIVDLAGLGYAQDPAFVRDVANAAGIHVVLGTGFRGDGWALHLSEAWTPEVLARHFVRAISAADPEGIRAGVIGPIGIGRRPTTTDHVALDAAARAQQETGCAIVVSVDLGAEPEVFDRVLDRMEASGATLTRVAVGRIMARPDLVPVCRVVVERGAFLSFDCFGQGHRLLMADMLAVDEEVQVASIKGFLDLGFGPHMLLSQAVDHVTLFTVNGGGGYAHILSTVMPRALDYQVTEAQARMLLVDNPRRFLAGT